MPWRSARSGSRNYSGHRLQYEKTKHATRVQCNQNAYRAAEALGRCVYAQTDIFVPSVGKDVQEREGYLHKAQSELDDHCFAQLQD